MDKRIIRTKQRLKYALLDLLNKKNIHDITVLELCKTAKINRTTFYKYYTDTNDVSLAIEKEIMDEAKKQITNINRNYLLSFTNHIVNDISKNKELYIPLLGPNGDHSFLRKILKLVYKESIDEWTKLLRKANKEDIEKIYNFIVDGTIGVVTNWINNKCKDDTNNISIFINKICMSGLSSFI